MLKLLSSSYSTSVFPGSIFLVILSVLAGCAGSPAGNPKPKTFPVFPPPPEQARFIYERTLYNSLDVEKEDSTNQLRRLLTGEQRRGEGLAKPFDVEVYKGRVYVTDTVHRSVMVFDVPGNRFFRIGTEGPGQLYLPLGISTDAKGNLYVCDGTAKHVVVYDKNGKYLRSIGGRRYFTRPSGVAVDANGQRVYVVDTGGVSSQSHKVSVFDAQTGKFIRDLGSRGSALGKFNLPRDVEVGRDGSLYVMDSGNFRVQVFTHNGIFKLKFGGIGRRSGQFSRPKGISVDSTGNLYVVDTAFGNVQIFTPDGKLLMAIGSRGGKDAPGKYMLPAGVDVDEDGRIYVVDQFFRKVDIYRPAALLPTTKTVRG